jgi:hypothetical protein
MCTDGAKLKPPSAAMGWTIVRTATRATEMVEVVKETIFADLNLLGSEKC